MHGRGLFSGEELRRIAEELGRLQVSLDLLRALVPPGLRPSETPGMSFTDSVFSLLAACDDVPGDSPESCPVLEILRQARWSGEMRFKDVAVVDSYLCRGAARWPWWRLEEVKAAMYESVGVEILDARARRGLLDVWNFLRTRQDPTLSIHREQVTAWWRWRVGEPAEAEYHLLTAWRLCVANNREDLEAELCIDLGEVHRATGNLDVAARWLVEALAILGEHTTGVPDSDDGATAVLWNRALLELAKAQDELGMRGSDLLRWMAGRRGEHVEQVRSSLERGRLERTVRASVFSELPTERGPREQVIAGRYKVICFGSDMFDRFLLGVDIDTSEHVWVVLRKRGSIQAGITAVPAGDPRMDRLPGLPSLLAQGLDDGTAYAIYKYEPCTWFPGIPGGRSWSAIEPCVMILIAQMESIQFSGGTPLLMGAHGLRVTLDGRPLHLGPLLSAAGRDDRTMAAELLGKPAGADAREPSASIYALGVLLRDFLRGPEATRSGVGPTDPWSWSVPDHVRATLERMCSLQPASRPQSMLELRVALRGGVQPATGAQIMARLSWADQHPTVVALVQRAREGRSASICTAGGVLMAAVKRRLLAEGYEVLEAQPGADPFESLLRSGALADLRKDVEDSTIERALVGRLSGSKVVLIAEDDHRSPALELDPESRELLARIAQGRSAALSGGGRVCVLRTVPRSEPQDLKVEPIRPDVMQRWFDASRRVVDVPRRAAEWLFERTNGEPGLVGMELELWERFGHIELSGWAGGSPSGVEERVIRIDAARLERIQEEIRMSPPASQSGLQRARLNLEESEVLAWIHVAWPHATQPTILRILTEQLPWLKGERWSTLRSTGLVWTGQLVNRAVNGLVSKGLLYVDPNDCLLALTPSIRLLAWSMDEVSKAHEVVASLYDEQDPQSFRHMLLGRDPRLLSAATAEAGRLLRRGQQSSAVAVLERGFGVWIQARQQDRSRQAGPPEALRYLRLWFETALRSDAAIGLRRLRDEIDALAVELHDAPALAQQCLALRNLVDAAILVRHPSPAQRDQRTRAALAQELLEPGYGPLPPGLEYWRLWLSLLAARERDEAEGGGQAHEDLALEQITLAAQRGAATPPGPPALEIRKLAWEAFAAYRRSKPERALELLRRALSAEQGEPDWRRATLELEAIFLVDEGDYDSARERAEELRDLATQTRHARAALVAEYVIRQADYRAGAPMQLDEELVEIAGQAHLGSPWDRGVVLLVEAAVAWRAGDPTRGGELARRAAELLDAAPRLLMLCLEHACGRPWSVLSTPAAELAQGLRGHGLEWYAQGLALLAEAGATLAGEWVASVEQQAGRCTERQRNRCWEVMSIQDALQRLKRRPPLVVAGPQ